MRLSRRHLNLKQAIHLFEMHYSDSDGKFTIAGLTPGPHRFELNFNLNGYRGNHQSDPIDIVEADEMQIEVFGPLSPEPETAEKPVSKPEEVDYIQLVKVTGISSNRDGKLKVWVSVKPTGERHRLSVGESFQLGDKEYKVKSVEEREATFTGDGKTFVARPDFETRGAFKETEQLTTSPPAKPAILKIATPKSSLRPPAND